MYAAAAVPPRPARRVRVGGGRLHVGFRRPFRVGAHALVVLCLLGALASNGVPALASLRGEQLLVVLSGSMTPTFRTGDAVLVRKPLLRDLRVGQIISFHAPGQPQRLTTHRIHSMRHLRQGWFVQTKGDANAAPDPDFTPISSIRGILDERLPHAGVWLSRSQSPTGKLVLYGLPLTLLLVQQGGALIGRRLGRGALPGRSAVLVAATAVLAVSGGVVASRSGALYTDADPVGANTLKTAASICANASGYANRVLQDTPAIYYRFGETSGTAAADKSGNARNGVYQGSPTLNAPGAIKCDGTNGGVGLNGTSQWVSNAASSANPQTFSLEAWFRTTTGAGKLIGFGNSATGTSSVYDRHLYINSSGQVVFGVYPGSVKTINSPASYLDDRWHHAVATFSSSTGMQLYVDGTRVAVDTTVTSAESGTGYWHVGFDQLSGWTSTGSNYFKGTLDDVAIYTTVLSATSIKAHYDANTSST